MITNTVAIRKKQVLVTGASGTLGFNILRDLVKSGNYTIIAPVRNRNAQSVEFGNAVQFIDHELSDAIHTAQIFERVNPDVIVHCAASGLRPPKKSWFDLMHFNVESTMRLFQMNCRFDHHSHFIYISTGLVYRDQGRPLLETDAIETLHPYGASKAAGDAMLQAAAAEFGRRLTILRPFAFTGVHDGGERLFPSILNAASKGTVMPMTAGAQIRDFCAVNDIARAIRLAIEQPQVNLIEKFNLGSGYAKPLHQLVQDVCSQLGIRVNFDFGAVRMHPHEPHHSVADITRARERLGWVPEVSLARAVWELAQDQYPQLHLKEPNDSAA